MKTLKTVLVNTGLFLVSLVIFILASELLLRAIHFKPPEIVTQEKYKDTNDLYLSNSRGLWCGRLGQPVDFENVVVTNSLALHDTEHTFEKKEGVYRILILGDSFVEAWQVPLEQTFFKIIERDLNKKARELFNKDSVEVIAIGRSGAGSVVEARDLTDLGLRYSPDLVMAFMTDQNDFKDDIFMMDRMRNPDKYRQRQDISGSVNTVEEELKFYERLIVFKKSILNRWLAFRIFEITQKPKAEAERRSAYGEDMGIYEKEGESLFNASRETWKSAFVLTAGNHIQMARLSRQNHAGYVTVFIPNSFVIEPQASRDLYRMFPQYKGKLDFRRPVDSMKRGFDKYQVDYLDLNEDFFEFYQKTRRPFHFRHDGHWNKEGHELAAKLIENYLVKAAGEGKLKA